MSDAGDRITLPNPDLWDLPSVHDAGVHDAGMPHAPPYVLSPQPRPTQYRAVRGSAGFWRLVQDQNGVWWFLSPDDKLEFLNTVTTVQPAQKGRHESGPHYVSRDWNGGITREGDIDTWAAATLRRVLDSGFKGLGAWCHPVFHDLDVPVARDLNLWTWMSGSGKRLYSPDWATVAEYAVSSQVAHLRDNRNLIGYFTDNELDWGDGSSGPGTYFDHLPPDDPNRLEVIKVIRSVWTSIDAFNADWEMDVADWSELNTWQKLPHEPAPAYGRLFSAWLSHLAEDYFRITSDLVRKYDPNHLILGVRFKGYAPLEVVRASRDYTDAQSLNYYVSDARLDDDLFEMMYEQSGHQPIIIGEYSFHSLDGRSGNRNTVGFSAQVLDQQARADGYRLFTTRLARLPYVIGADWFQWSDEPPSGRISDGEDVNFGVVDIDDNPYELLVNSIRETAPRLNALHAASHEDGYGDVFRESFAEKPVVNVPYLVKPIYLNGELSDWPAETRLTGVRHAQTVGLERSRLPLPNIHLGWNEDGLFMGMEIFDDDIQGAPPQGWWWTRDHVEFWISSRPPGSDQNGYDVYSHQFFFVPVDFPGKDNLAGIIGQWHRPGDALQDSLIPHPQIKNAARVLPGRYVVEMFIPNAAINGFDPVNQPAMAFNIHVRNFQHAISYFWSAPKEIMTQLRPSTWGHMYLDPKPDAPLIESAAAID